MRRIPQILLLGMIASFGQAGAPAAELPSRPYAGSFPQADSKKGLQVELVDDAIALGVRHAAINVDLARLIAPAANESKEPSERFVRFRNQDGEFAFHADYLRSIEGTIRPLSESGALVYVILLAYETGDPTVNRILLHPEYDRRAPNHVAALNVVSGEGRAWLAAAIECLAERWSRPSGEHGRVVGYIVGNEVNSHWFWNNRGRATLEEFTDDYVAAVRIVHAAVRRQAVWPRVYVSLDHHWNIAMAGADVEQCVPGKAFLDLFARRVKETSGGDFDWHVAYHPYPENLFEPRFWNDTTATDSFDAPRITFKNLQVLQEYMRRTELRFDGRPRRIILSEQGFHTPPGDDGETVQAAAFCDAYAKVERLPGVDAFILHRHVDHPDEGGLNLGLRRRVPQGADPYPKKKIYDCFRAAGTPSWDKASAFALPIVGLKSWDDVGISHRTRSYETGR